MYIDLEAGAILKQTSLSPHIILLLSSITSTHLYTLHVPHVKIQWTEPKYILVFEYGENEYMLQKKLIDDKIAVQVKLQLQTIR